MPDTFARPNRMLAGLSARWAAFAQSRQGMLALRVGRWLFVVGIVGYLAFRLAEIGWGEVIRSLPTTPWFYVLFFAAFLQLPFVETLIYRTLWDFPYGRGLAAFFKKRVFNQDVLGYSGEVYLYVWARRHVRGARDRDLLKAIRDNNILSSAASTLVALGLLGFFIYGGYVDIRAWLGEHSVLEVGLAVVAVVVVGALAVRFRRYLFSMPPRQAAFVFSLHVARLLVANALLLAQWIVVIPEVSLATWFTFMAVAIVLDRIPFLPNRDLLFFGVGLEMGGALGVPMSALAGMLLAFNVLTKGLNLAFLAVSFFGFRDLEPAAGLPAPEPEAALKA